MATGYKHEDGYAIYCGACLRSYVADKIFRKDEFKPLQGGHCDDCFNCIGHDRRRCDSPN